MFCAILQKYFWMVLKKFHLVVSLVPKYFMRLQPIMLEILLVLEHSRKVTIMLHYLGIIDQKD